MLRQLKMTKYIRLNPELDIAEIDVDDFPGPNNLLERVGERLRLSPEILEGAEEFGQDIGAIVTSRGAKMVIGSMLLATFAAIGATVVYKATHKKEQKEEV